MKEYLKRNKLASSLIIMSAMVSVCSILREFIDFSLGWGLVVLGFYAIGFLLVLVTIGRTIYYIFSAGSFFDLKKRAEKNRPYRNLVPSLLSLLFYCLSLYLYNHRGWLPILKNADQARLVEHYMKNHEEFELTANLIKAKDGEEKIEGHLKRLGLCGSYKESPQGNMIMYLYEDPIWANAGYFKGYAYSDKEITITVKNIDTDAPWARPSFQRINKNWYLYFYYY